MKGNGLFLYGYIWCSKRVETKKDVKVIAGSPEKGSVLALLSSFVSIHHCMHSFSGGWGSGLILIWRTMLASIWFG